MISLPRRPLPPSVPERQRSYDENDDCAFDTNEKLHTETTCTTLKAEQSPKTHRKSVSFDLSDNEYIPVLENEPHVAEPAEDLAELFFRQLSQESNNAENDGYEVPIKYPAGYVPKQPKQVKSILRSPSPSNQTHTPSSLDRPLRTSRIPQPSNQTVATAVVHTAKSLSVADEIERENPFRKEFLQHKPYENIYEEIDSENQSKEQKRPIESTNASKIKMRPKSAYSEDSLRAYTENQMVASQSIELLANKSNDSLSSEKPYKSTGSLPVDRPKQKPPLPPKPTSTTNIKHAELKKNEALRQFQNEMLRGDLYEFIHDAETNKVTKVQQLVSNIVDVQPQDENINKESARLGSFSQSSPLPPIPNTNIPSYSKVCKRGTSVERPSQSPPPPPINLSTLPSADILHSIKTDDGYKVEILTTTSADDATPKKHNEHNENSAEYSLVTEETHREILLRENEIRNAMQQERQQVITENLTNTSRIPVRKAPLPPSQQQKNQACSTTTTTKHASEETKTEQIEQLTKSSTTITTNIAPASATKQIYPPTQVLPVQYSKLPMPQQPDYYISQPNFLSFSSSPPLNVSYSAIPEPIKTNTFSTFMVSENNALNASQTQSSNNASQSIAYIGHLQQHPTSSIPYHIDQTKQFPSFVYMREQPCVVQPLTTFHSINQHGLDFRAQNYTNIPAQSIPQTTSSSLSYTSLTPPSPSSNNNSNNNHNNNMSNASSDVYRSNYNHIVLQQQQQMIQQQQYHHPYHQQPSLLQDMTSFSNNNKNHPQQMHYYNHEQNTIDNRSFDRSVGTSSHDNELTKTESIETTSSQSLVMHKNYYDVAEGSDEPDYQNVVGKQTSV